MNVERETDSALHCTTTTLTARQSNTRINKRQIIVSEAFRNEHVWIELACLLLWWTDYARGYCIFVVLQQDKTNSYHWTYGTINGIFNEWVKWTIRASKTKLEFSEMMAVHYLYKKVPFSVTRTIMFVQFKQNKILSIVKGLRGLEMFRKKMLTSNQIYDTILNGIQVDYGQKGLLHLNKQTG
jgi:hypothetical protein